MASSKLLSCVGTPMNLTYRTVFNTTLRAYAAKKTTTTKKTKKSTKNADVSNPVKAAAATKTTKTQSDDIIPQDQATYDSYASTYKCPEYYGYNDMSYYDIENNMAVSRLPQPSSV